MMAEEVIVEEIVESGFFELFGITFGTLDIGIILIILVMSIYWMFFKKPPVDPATQFQSYTIQPTTYTSRTNESSFITKMKSSGRNMVVFYGSQTGTGEEFAGRLAKEAQRYGMKGMLADPEECSIEELTRMGEIPSSLAVFCMATYGEGDPTDNAQEFYEWLQQGECDLSGLNYAVFALGNKTYEHYNAMGKYVDERLEALGGRRVFEMGNGDDDANIEEDFISWKERFWPAVCDTFGVVASSEDISTRQYRLVEHDESLDPDKIYRGEVMRLKSYERQRPPFDPKNPFMSNILINRELFRGGERSCMHLELDITNSKMRYDSGDHVALYPSNDTKLVDKIGELLGVDLDKVISLLNLDEDSSKKYPFPCPTSYRTALTYYLDITSHPRSHVLKELSDYATNPEDKEFLTLLGGSSDKGKEKYNQWVLSDCRTIVHILEDLPSCKPPLDHLCELLPKLQARYYSISSSPKVYPNTIHVTAALVKYETPTGRVNKGVATSWLAEKRYQKNGYIPSDPTIPLLVPIFVRKSQFRLPTRPLTPVIMIGPGTGIAPFRGFIQERSFYKDEGKQVGRTILFFGCRNKAIDFIYEEELQEYVDKGILELHVAYSRDTSKKVYVQHLLAEKSKELWKLIGQENAHLYVCGDAKNMARDVRDVIEKIVREEGGEEVKDPSAYVKRMEAQKRYSADVWS